MKRRKSSCGKVFTKNTSWKKRLVLLEIAIVLFSVFLVATLPAIAAEQIDEPLGIYGNANEDDTIDMRDTTYIKLVIFGKKPKTDLADANNDGKVSMLDVGQTKLIILGKEKKLTVVDSADRIVTLDMPVERVVTYPLPSPPIFRLLKATDKVVGVGEGQKTAYSEEVYPEMSKKASAGTRFDPDYEIIVERNTQVLIIYTSRAKTAAEILPDEIKVLGLDFYVSETYDNELKLLSKILGKENEEVLFEQWKAEKKKLLQECLEGLSPEEEKTVYIECDYQDWKAYSPSGSVGYHVAMAGGENIFTYDEIGFSKVVDPEEIIERDPTVVIIFRHTGHFETPEEIRDRFLGRPAVKESKLGERCEVYVINNDICGMANSPLGAFYCLNILYPERFKDIDADEVRSEFYGELLDTVPSGGIEFTVYPPLSES